MHGYGEEVYDKIINKMCYIYLEYKLECNELECPRSAHEEKDDSTLMICTYYTSSR